MDRLSVSNDQERNNQISAVNLLFRLAHLHFLGRALVVTDDDGVDYDFSTGVLSRERLTRSFVVDVGCVPLPQDRLCFQYCCRHSSVVGHPSHSEVTFDAVL
jgi:hypothetical protein